MASLYQRNGSPFWWVKYRCPSTGLTKRESTGFRVGVGADRQKAREIAAEKSLTESRTGFAGKTGESWDAWVPSYVETRYGGSPRSLERVKTAWKKIETFLGHRHIPAPRHVSRETCLDFVAWCKTKPGGEVSHNGALLNLRFLSAILGEAVRRGFASHNPAVRLDIKREKTPEKPEISDAEIEQIRAEIKKVEDAAERHMLNVSFEIALAQGCRIFETWLDVNRDVNLDAGTIQFRAKGKFYTTELNPTLRPLIHELRTSGRTMTFELRDPRRADGRDLSAVWCGFLKRIGLGHLSFHSLRVTCVTRLHRAGVPESVAMKIVGHAGTTVHRVYRRVKREEGQSAWANYNKGMTPANVVPFVPAEDHQHAEAK